MDVVVKELGQQASYWHGLQYTKENISNLFQSSDLKEWEHP
jgi:hypothetical protein